MAREKKLVLTFDNKGEMTIDASGFPDGTCLKETASIEEALGKVTNREKKPEAFINTPATQKIGSF